ncbi:MAG: hypothetical protein H8E57_09045 [Candidatus Cloacimonetes bacterium]|nr:hypothetical protein [Candidatus Cloacimonadota bacterium]
MQRLRVIVALLLTTHRDDNSKSTKNSDRDIIRFVNLIFLLFDYFEQSITGRFSEDDRIEKIEAEK